MYRDEDTLVLEKKDCGRCTHREEWRGTVPTEKPCPVCDGTGKGPRGGRRGCQNCRGSGTVWDHENRQPCPRCGGDWKDAEDETVYDKMPPEIIQSLDFRVYRDPDRPRTLNEGLLGFGTVCSVTDYGRYKALTDTELIDKIKSGHSIATFGVQALKIVDDTLEFPDHIGIFCHSQGYSVRAVHERPDDVHAKIANEREYHEGLMLGARLAEKGLNGTMLAIHKE